MFSKQRSHPPVIVLLDGKAATENSPIKAWLRHSRFTTCEAADLLTLMEAITDYTRSERPDVFVLEVDSLSDYLDSIQQYIRTSATDETELPVLALAPVDGCPKRDDCFVGSFKQVKEKLNAYIPNPLHSKAAVT
ncbi:MAG TPA: hypothetical protein VL325_08250 [Pyrinomonadaceae bacterium]|jgi:hypothetical protein|nr:hypothetical protein [Pyrinomonadaceae bacterium]